MPTDARDCIRHWIDLDERLALVQTVPDVWAAAEAGKLGVIIHAQTLDWIERDLRHLRTLWGLGLRVGQLTYNRRNYIGDGCQEKANAGLSDIGRQVVKEMNSLGMVVDLSHCGRATSLDALRLTTKPAIFSHSGCTAVYPHVRNITDDQIRAVADTGGVVGFNAVPFFTGPEPSIEHVVRHAVHVAELTDVRHVGMGLDYYAEIMPYVSAAEQRAADQAAVASGLWNDGDFYPEPTSFPPGIETPAGLPNLITALRREFTEHELAQVLGGNWLRVFEANW